MSAMRMVLMYAVYTQDIDVCNREWRDVCNVAYAIHIVVMYAMYAVYTTDIDICKRQRRAVCNVMSAIHIV